jgi:HAD superfamily hydrolase (TIGR01549 family)
VTHGHGEAVTSPQHEPANDAVILFDIDGTLIDSTYHHALAWQRAFERCDLPIPLWRIHRTIGMGGDKLVGEVAGEQVEEEKGDTLRDLWSEEYSEIKAEVRPLPGAVDLVKAAVDAGYRVALASSGEKEFSEEAVRMLGLEDVVTEVTTSADVEDSKPDPDLLQTTIDKVGGVRRAVFVGDTPYDVQAADRVGLACLTFRTGGFSQAELEDAGAVLVVDGPDELVDVDWETYLRDV